MNSNYTEKLIKSLDELLYIIETKINLVSLRPKLDTEAYQKFEGDYDFLIPSNQVSTLLTTIYLYSKDNGINFKLSQTKATKKRFSFFIDDQKKKSIVWEFWTAIEYTDSGQRKFLSENILAVIEKQPNLRETILCAIYITHLYHKDKDILTEENQFRFKHFLNLVNGYDNGVTTLLRSVFDNTVDLKTANGKAVRMLENLEIRSQSNGNNLSCFFRKIIQRIFNLKHITPIVGPDGSGKGAVSKALFENTDSYISHRFKSLYRVRYFYKIRIKLFGKRRIENEPLNKLDEELNYYIFFMSSVIIRMIYRKKRKRKILMDRYFIDYYGSPIRYLKEKEKPKKMKFYNLIRFFTPIPYKMVFLSCRNATLHQRKNELTDNAIYFLEKVYMDFILKKNIPSVLFISTENSIELSQKTLTDFLIQS